MRGLCIRGTFIGCVPHVPPPRSASAPARMRSDSDEMRNQMKHTYMSELRDKADEMRQVPQQDEPRAASGAPSSPPSPGAASLVSSGFQACSVVTMSSEEDEFGFMRKTMPQQNSATTSENVDIGEPCNRAPGGLPLVRLPSMQSAVHGGGWHQSDEYNHDEATFPVAADSFSSKQDLNSYAQADAPSSSNRPTLQAVIGSRGYLPYVPVAASSSSNPAQHNSQGQSAPVNASSVSGTDSRSSQNPDPGTILTETDTTLMLGNLPFKLTSMDFLMEGLAENGFAGTYDLIYIPPRQKAKRVKSDTAFCFVNFKNHVHAVELLSKADAFIVDSVERRISVTRAKKQGFTENVMVHADAFGNLANDDCLRAFSN